MSSIRTSCKDNPRLGRVGCGATYRGNMVHCTICHETFATYRTMDKHLGVTKRGDLWHEPPETVRGLWRDDRGIWHLPGSRDPAQRATSPAPSRTESSPRGER